MTRPPRSLRLPGLTLALLVGLTFPALADDVPPTNGKPDAGGAGSGEPPGTPPGPRTGGYAPPTLRGDLSLSLADAIRMGLENNLNVEVDRYDPHIVYENVEQAWGAYDPGLFSDFSYESIQLENSLVLNGQFISSQRQTGGESGFQGIVPVLGSRYSLTYGSNRATTNSTIEGLSPKYESNFTLAFTQPLARDLIWNEPWFRVRNSKILYAASLDQFTKDVMDIVQRIQDLYWNLIARGDQVGVAEKSLETARALLEQTKTQHDVGVVSRVEVVEAEAGVAQREFDQIRAQNLYSNSQDDLIDAVLGTGLTADSTLQIHPTDQPDEYIPFDIDPETAVATAFETRTEIGLANKDIEQREISLRFAENQRLPRFDARVSYGNQGLAGEQNPDAFDLNSNPPEPLPPGTIPTRPWGRSMDD